MLNPIRKYQKTQDRLQEGLSCIFAKTFDPSKFFPLLAQMSDDPDLKQPATLLFSVYNLLIRQQPSTAFNGLIKIENTNPNSMANVASIVLKSSYQAYKKKYKQSLDSLEHAIKLTQQQKLDRQLGSFYSQVITRLIQIFQFGAFRKDYLSLIQRVLNKYESQVQSKQILKALSKQKTKLREKACLLRKKEGFGSYCNTQNSQVKQLKYSFKLKLSRQQSSQKSQKQKSLSSSKKSSFYSPKSKYNFRQIKKKQYINPYGLNYIPQQVNKCIFM